MLAELLNNLTKEQIAELDRLGIPSSRRSEWKRGPRKPTAAQCMVLAMVTNTDVKLLIEELAEREATPEQLDFFRRVQTHGTWRHVMGMAAAILSGAVAMPDPSFAQCSSGQTHLASQAHTMHLVVLMRLLARRLRARIVTALQTAQAVFFLANICR